MLLVSCRIQQLHSNQLQYGSRFPTQTASRHLGLQAGVRCVAGPVVYRTRLSRCNLLRVSQARPGAQVEAKVYLVAPVRMCLCLLGLWL
jgi:hypothetical protein